MNRVVTIAREFGSGGGAVAQILAERLGWRLVDRTLIERAAAAATADAESIAQLEERVDSWFYRMVRALWSGGYEGVVTTESAAGRPLDAELVARTEHRLIEEAAAAGECIIVGRGAQCILRGHPGVFHVFVYAPWRSRVERVRGRAPAGADCEDLIIKRDRARALYVRHYFGMGWYEPHLYHLMVNSDIGLERVADAITCAAQLGGAQR